MTIALVIFLIIVGVVGIICAAISIDEGNPDTFYCWMLAALIAFGMFTLGRYHATGRRWVLETPVQEPPQ